MTRPTRQTAVVSLLLLCGAARVSLGQPAPADPPAVESPVERLVRTGAVELRYYDPSEQPREFPGWTEFNYDVRHRYTYEYDERKRGKAKQGVLRIKVELIKLDRRHVVHLPRAPAGAKPWADALSLHELDHVAISADVRPELLIAHLHRNLTRLELNLAANEKVDDGLLRKTIEDELTARRKAVIELVNFYNRALDRLTRHGVDPLPAREEFFARMFTKPGLDEAKFAYTGEVLDLIRSNAYQQSAPIHLTIPEEPRP